MPFQQQPFRRVPVIKEKNLSEFRHADGSSALHDQYTKITGPGQATDIETVAVDQKQELSCGCIWPDAPVAGICAQCLAEQRTPHVCAAHYVVCACGTACCWKHSHPSAEGDVRLCTRCHIRQANENTKAAVAGALGWIARRLLTRSSGSGTDDPQP